MGRLVLGRPGPVTHKEERGTKREKIEKEERKKERRRKKRKGKKRREEREENLRPIWAGYSVFRLCTVYKALNITVRHRPQVGLHITDIGP